MSENVRLVSDVSLVTLNVKVVSDVSYVMKFVILRAIQRVRDVMELVRDVKLQTEFVP